MLSEKVSPNAIRRAFSVFLFALVCQTAFLIVLPKAYRTIEASDYFTFYGPVAQNLAEGRGLVINGKLPSRYPPGFPAYLAPQFFLAEKTNTSPLTVIKIFNVFVSSITCVVVFFLAEVIFGERVGFVSALLWAAYPFNLWLTKQPDSEIPFMLVFLLALLCYFRGLRSGKIGLFVGTGLLLAGAGLIRPIALFVALILAVLLTFYRPIPFARRLLLGATVLAAFAAAVLPWEVELKAYTGHFAPLSTGGPVSIFDGLTFPAKSGNNTRGRAWVPKSAEALAYRLRGEESSLQTPAEIATALRSEWHSAPAGLIEMGLLKIVRSWYGADSMRHEAGILVIQCVCLLFALPGVWLAWRDFAKERFEIVVLFALVLYFWGMTTMVLSILRYMVPVMPVISMFAGVTFASLLVRYSKESRSKQVLRPSEVNG
jgi:4-amino-4-deoxy-L-arabinose transferase-like glycosyltransferase